MSQVSRPFQIALVALVLFLAVWFVALRGHSSSPSSAPSASPAAAPASGSASSGSKTYTGSAPGVAGLSGAIAKAHGAVKTSQQNAQQLQQKSGQASSSTGGTPTASTPTASSAAPTTSTPAKGSTSTGPSATAKQSSPGGSAAGSAKPNTTTARQTAIQHELAAGKIVALMFWNPKSTDDQAVRQQLHDLSRRQGEVAVHVAIQGQVASFGAYTRGVQVLETPTVLVIGKGGKVTTLTGLSDARSIQQTIGDALRGGAGKTLAPTLTAWLHGSKRSAYIGRANALCERFTKSVKRPQVQSGSVKSLLSTLHTEVGLSLGLLAKLRSIAPPSADRAYIDQMIAVEHRSLTRIDGVTTKLQAGNPSGARVGLLQAQALDDEATNGLYSYGLTACANG